MFFALQAEATLLKTFTSGGSATKIVALGISSGNDQSELQDIASLPHQRNIILVQDFNNLNNVQDQLRQESCTRKQVNSPLSY